MKVTFTFVAFAAAILSTGFLVSCKKQHQNPAPVVDSLKVGLIAYYPFNNSAADASGNGNDGTTNNVAATTDRKGNANSAYAFDGISSYISIPDNPSLRLSNTDFTINTWINLDVYDPSFGSFILCKRSSGVNDGFGLSITGYQFNSTGQGGAGLPYFGGGGTNLAAIGKSSIGTTNWNMITVVYNFSKQEISLYLNGTLNNTTENFPSPNGSITNNFYIGRDDPASPSTGYFVKGKIDDIRIYGRALSHASIQQLYNSSN